MPITPAQVAAAAAIQHAAAQDTSSHVRLVAGPGTGKSASIEERVCWLIRQGVPATEIFTISFTRASAHDLRLRIHLYAAQPGYHTIDQVPVTTMHSLALRILRAAGLLNAYPTEPLVLDDWELTNIFDEEFGNQHGIGKVRREEIRREHEAYWSTGAWNPANYLPPNPPITTGERANFTAFHGPRTQTYACVLPGEIIRLCVQRMATGLLNAVDLLGIKHLIVDEFQDLNPLDLQFVNHISQQGARVFVAGDDDQSVYSFRFADPTGIQNFHTMYAGCGQHQLSACFRCTPEVLAASLAVINQFPAAGRIPKAPVSLYAAAAPAVQGMVHRWKFVSSQREATAIAESCRDLIHAGMNPRDILILLSNQRALSQPLVDELTAANVPAEHPREEGFIDLECGRLVYALLRIVSNSNDYVAHRAVLGLRRGVAVGRCRAVFDAVNAGNVNFRSIFYNALPGGVFNGHALTTVNHARTTCAALAGWALADTIAQRSAEITQIITNHFNAAAAVHWQTFITPLPPDMILEELLDFMRAETDEQQRHILEAVMQRLNQEIPEEGVLQPRVRIMTMHGAKGLSGKVVFIPGLEEEIFPGPWRQPYPGLILEAARLLYVSITRARAACIISLSHRRMVNGSSTVMTPSRFAPHTGGVFGPANRNNGLTAPEVAQIIADCGNL